MLPVSMLTASLVLAACGSGTPNAASLKKHIRSQNRELAVKYAISVAPQATKGFSVIVKSLSVTEGKKSGTGGYVAIASDVAGKPGDILGYTKVADGTLRNVKITVVDKLTTGNYFFLLYPTGAAPTQVGTPQKKMVARVTVG
jgi:hypothetical protein